MSINRSEEKLPKLMIVKLSKLEQGNAAHLSLRFVTWLELVSVFSSVLLTVWAIVPLYPQNKIVLAVPALLSLSLIFYSQHIREETIQELGLSSAHFWMALRLLLVPVFSCGLFLMLFGYLNNSLHRSTHFEVNLFVVPFWGVIQQLVLQGFIFRRVRKLLVTDGQSSKFIKRQINIAILVTSSLFSLAHLPNITLSILTFVAALFWSWVYERAPNLWVLGFSHGLLSLIVMHSLPDWVLHSMSIGYKHFLYQKF